MVVESTRRLKRGTIEVDWILDIETEKWSTFVCGCLYNVKTGEPHIYLHGMEREFVDFIFAQRGTVWAHNGGRFDALWLLNWSVKLGYPARVFATSARVTSIQYLHGLKICDSAALVPMTLREGARIGGVEKLETGLPCECGKECGGYCSIRRDMPHSRLTKLCEYLIQDCRAVAAMLETLSKYAHLNDLDLRATVGSSAWATARRRYNLPDAKLSSDHYALASQAKYGGRVQVFRPEAMHGWRYDVNAAYIAALASTALPVGSHREVAGTSARRQFEIGAPGIFCVLVNVPEMHIPPLPKRINGRVYYPTGEFAGCWSRLELDYARSLGCTIKSFGRALVWEAASPVMVPFAELDWELRDAAGKSTPLGKWLKCFGNSAIGKLGQNPEHDVIVTNSDEIKPCPGGKQCGGILCGQRSVGCCDHRCIATCGGYRQLGGPSSAIFAKTQWRLSSNAHVEWNIYLTSKARIELHRQLISDGQGGLSAVYCDTDSCYATLQRSLNVGPALGQWLLEGEFQWFESLGPKLYTYLDPTTGKRSVRAKGIGSPDWSMLKAGQPMRDDRGVNQLRTGIRSGNLFTRKVVERRSRHDGIHFGDRIRDGEITRAFSIKEIVNAV